MEEPARDDVLWTRYVDWCSARVAERFLALSADQVWEVASRARERSGASAPPPEPPVQYQELVRRVTLDLFYSLELPAFADWSELYRANPELYDRELLGFEAAGETEQALAGG